MTLQVPEDSGTSERLREQDEKYKRYLKEGHASPVKQERHLDLHDIWVKQQTANLNRALDEGAQVAPDALERLYKVKARTGLPLSYVERHLKELEPGRRLYYRCGRNVHHAGVFNIQTETSRLDTAKNPTNDSGLSHRNVAPGK